MLGGRIDVDTVGADTVFRNETQFGLRFDHAPGDSRTAGAHNGDMTARRGDEFIFTIAPERGLLKSVTDRQLAAALAQTSPATFWLARIVRKQRPARAVRAVCCHVNLAFPSSCSRLERDIPIGSGGFTRYIP
jgi:hypothetical protein